MDSGSNYISSIVFVSINREGAMKLGFSMNVVEKKILRNLASLRLCG